MARFWRRKPELLLCPRIPLPLHGVNPRSILGKVWWDRERTRAAYNTNGHCEACGVHKTRAKGRQWIEGHEYYQIDYRVGKSVYERTIPLCHYCHNFIHCGRMWTLMNQGKMPQRKYSAVMNHGTEILSKVGLKKLSPIEQEEHLKDLEDAGDFAPWEEWRLVLFGNEYPSLYKSKKEYEQAYQN